MASITNGGQNLQTWPGVNGKLVMLMPGDTEVTEEQLAVLRKHPVFQDYLKRKLLTLNLTDEEQELEVLERIAARKKTLLATEEKEEREEITLDESLSGISQRELVKRIGEMTDKEQLELLSQDDRSRVAEAAKQQLASL